MPSSQYIFMYLFVLLFKMIFHTPQLVSERWSSPMEAWRSTQPLWRIQETSPALLPMLRANPRGGWSLSWPQCPTWQTAPAGAATRPLNPPPLTFWPPPRSRCRATRQEVRTGGCRWWSWPETPPSLGGAVRPLYPEFGCSRSSTTAQGTTHWCTGWFV